MRDVLLSIYFLAVTIASLATGVTMSYEIEFESNVFKKAIYVQIDIWYKYRNEINGFGLALMEVFVTLFCWPVNCIIIVVFGLEHLIDLLWRGFKYIFRRKEK